MKLDSKQKKFLLIGGSVVLAVYLISKWLHNRPKPLPIELESDTLDKTKVLKRGSQGLEVSELQRILKKDYNAKLGETGENKDGIDGDFGILTEVALKQVKGVSETTLNDL